MKRVNFSICSNLQEISWRRFYGIVPGSAPCASMTSSESALSGMTETPTMLKLSTTTEVYDKKDRNSPRRNFAGGVLVPLGLTAYRLAKEIQVPVPRINDIVLEKRGISADTALQLGRYFNLPARFWMELQTEYELRLASNSAKLDLIVPRSAA